MVRDRATNAPLANVVVGLIDSVGRPTRRATTNTEGHFVLAALFGERKIDLVRIGYAPQRVAFSDTTAGHLTIRMDAIPNWLSPVATVDAPGCPRRADRPVAFALWEQSRAALLATIVARETNHGTYGVTTYDRLLYKAPATPVRKRRQNVAKELSPLDTSRVLSQRLSRLTVESGHPIHSDRDPASFAVTGFMEQTKGRRLFFAPDPDVVLDTLFAVSHCFSVPTDRARHRGEVGVSFEPARGRDSLVEVSGTLWLDSASRELRTLEFRYTGIEGDAMRAGAGGELHFLTMPNGVVAIDRWNLRVPYRDTYGVAVFGSTRPAGDSAWLLTRTGELHDIGGVIMTASWPAGTAWRRPLDTLRGRIVERETGRPLRQVTVTLSGSDYTAVTDSIGAFELRDVLRGTYTLSAVDGLLDPIGVVTRDSQTVKVPFESRDAIQLSLPPRRPSLARVCRAVSDSSSTAALLTGEVHGVDDKPMRDARLHITWRESSSAGPERVLEAATDGKGRFRVCSVPSGIPIRVQARAGGGMVDDTVTIPSGLPLADFAITLRRPSPPR